MITIEKYIVNTNRGLYEIVVNDLGIDDVFYQINTIGHPYGGWVDEKEFDTWCDLVAADVVHAKRI